MYLVTNEEMKTLDQLAGQTFGLPETVLMEIAGRSVVDRIFDHWPHLNGPHPRPPVVVVGGPGNNGGDGWVMARTFLGLGFKVRSVLLGRAENLKGAAQSNYQIWRKLSPNQLEICEPRQLEALDFKGSPLIIDALFGTGLDRPLDLTAQALISCINQAGSKGAKIVSVDLPSGLNGDDGRIMGAAVKADLTVTLASPKRGLFLGQGPERSGPVRLGEIGLIPPMMAQAEPSARLITLAWARAIRPVRPENGHKGLFGQVMAVGGSAGKTGALALAVQGALRGGAGLVCAAGPASLLTQSVAARPEPLTLPLPESEPGQLSGDGARLLVAASRAGQTLVLGPGLGLNEEARRLTLETAAQAPGPLVLDADALTLIAETKDILLKRTGPTVLTPHPGEMSRLLGLPVSQVEADRFQAVRLLARQTGAVALLKGRHTLISGPEGIWALNLTGGPHLSAGGMGDVLAGLIGALSAQGHPPFEAAVLGAFAHGLAGDLAAVSRGPFGLMAGEVADHLPAVWRVLNQPAPAAFKPGLIGRVEL